MVDTLGLQPADHRDGHTTLALQLAREDQRIEGLPLDPIAVAPLLNPTNAVARARAAQDLRDRLASIEPLLRKERRAAERLQELGERHEAEQNAARWRRFKWGGGLTVILGGLVALLILVPAAAPILGRILAWVAGKLPSLAGALGVVSVRAFDAVVNGIERARGEDQGPAGLSNDGAGPRPGFVGWTALESSLSREMDASHKALVRVRKAVSR